MKLSALLTIIQANLPTNFHSTELTTAKLTEFINKSQLWVCRGSLFLPGGIVLNHNFSFLKQEVTRPTVDETQRYSLPVAGDTDWITVPSGGTVQKYKADYTCDLINSESYHSPLTKSLKKTLEEKDELRNALGYGIPKYYCIDGSFLWLYRIPAHGYNGDNAWTINLEFYSYLTDLSGDDDSNVLTDDYSDVLEWKATAAAFRFGFDIEQAEYYEGKAKEELARMISEDADRVLGALEEGLFPTEGQSLNRNT